MKLWFPALVLVASFALVGPLPCAAQSSDDTPPGSEPAAPVAEPAPSPEVAPTTITPVEPVAEPAPSAPPPDVAPTTITPVEPVAVPAAQTVAEPVATTVPVVLTSADERVLLHRTGASEGDRAFTFVCLLPCTAELAPGAYRFGATRGSDDPRAISDVVEIDRPGEWNVRFSDNSGLRDAGWGIALTGAVAAAAGIVLSIFVFPAVIDGGFGRTTTINTELMLAFVIPGSAAMITGMLLGLFSYDGVIVDETGVRF